MFNRYMPEDREAFEDLYRPVEGETADDPAEESIKDEPEQREIVASKEVKSPVGTDIRRLLKGIMPGELGIVPILILLFLVLDVDEEERLLIIALAFILGI